MPNFERFTDRARKAMQLARQLCDNLTPATDVPVSPRHVLYGILKEGDGVAVNVLRALRVDVDQLRGQIAATLNVVAGGESRRGWPGTTRECEACLAAATQAAADLGHAYVGTEHLLLGVLADGEVAGLLAPHGVTTVTARATLRELLGLPAG